ncbi:ROK family transcriptional regulator [Nocardioides zeae]|uniref:ROK family transcriptional regulator n=1 Tax=Nocardioides imazamoxiresistens TaxID=3231893 RepID=A0ABU3PR56_9ACTN|nr:ROK family transcriptional regulator [Nocardioides zeae]MDT9591715.1 ROK family transcriptional regulator [Nocardioides zeae]
MSTSDLRAGASGSPGSTATLRTANQRRVLDVLRRRVSGGTSPDVTQADLARITGLAPATVSNIVRDLGAAGLVATDPGAGRRGTVVRLAPSAGLVAGIDVGHSHLAVAVGDLAGRVLGELRHPLAPTHPHTEGLALAGRLLDELLGAEGLDRSHLRAVTTGLPAPLSGRVVASAAILPGWVGVDALAACEEAFGVPVHVENDANLGALAEHRLGVVAGRASSVFVKISSGVGAGIVLDDRLLHGNAGAAGEIGHLTLDERGPVCRCGSRGCLEAYASVGSVLAMMRDQLPDATLDDVVAAATSGNVSAQRSLEDAGRHLGWGLASAVNLLNPAVLVVGGDMARAGELLLEPVRRELRRHVLDAVADTPVLLSELGERASLVGAVLLAAELTDLLPTA